MSAPDFDEVARRITPDQLARAVGAEREGRSWRCPLPDRHENGDEDPSFSIFEDGGRTAAKCHACGLGGSPVSVYSQVTGVEPPEAAKELAREIGMHVPSENGGSREPEAVYTYRDLDGDVRFQVVRFPGKSFPQRRPDGSGGWTWGLDGVTKILYRLPEVVEAAALGRTVYVVEGEKDADRLREEGKVATTPPGGADGWRDHYADSLEGARVRVVMDRDEAGRKHARQVSESVRSVAESVEVLRPAVEEEGADVSDHLDAGHELSDLEPVNEADAALEGVDLVELAEYLDDPDAFSPPATVAYGMAYEGQATLLYGDPKGGKSTAAIGVGATVSSGTRWMSHPTERGRVLYVAAEGDRRQILRRFHEFGADPEGVDVVVPSLEPIEELRTLVQARDYRLVVLDTLGRWMAPLDVDRWKQSDVDTVLTPLERIIRESGAALLAIHHANAEGKPIDSTGFAAWADVLRKVEDGNSERERVVTGRARFAVPDLRFQLREDEDGSRFVVVDPDREIEERVLDFIAEHEPVTKRGIREGVDARASEIDAALRELEKRGAIEVDRSGAAHLHHIAR